MNDTAKTKATVLVAEDDRALRDAVCDTLELAGSTVLPFASAEEACEYLNSNDVDIIFSDVCMGEMDGHAFLDWVRQHKSHIPLVLMTAYGTIERSVDAMRSGAADYLVKPFQPRALLELIDRFVVGNISEQGLIAEDPQMRELVDLAKRVAATDSTVLLSGDSGTGKEVLARYIHAESPRAGKPFVAINCAAIPESMLEATLFGYEKGAFTGAYTASPGKFELADGGTLLLDEISEMDLGLQAKLLRVLQEREVERVGGRKTLPLDVRILATTNRDLRAEVQRGGFREDLFYRLSVFPLQIPALATRPADILPLAEHLLQHHAQRMNRSGMRLERSAIDKLLAYDWPGNVRELDNVMQRALILAHGERIGAGELLLDFARPLAQSAPGQASQSMPGTISQPLSQPLSRPQSQSQTQPLQAAAAGTAQGAEAGAAGVALQDELKQHEVEQIQQALLQSRGSKKDAAELLGLSPRTLRYRMARLREQGLLD